MNDIDWLTPFRLRWGRVTSPSLKLILQNRAHMGG